VGIVGTGGDSEPMFLSGDVQVVVSIVVLADRAMRVFRVRPGKHQLVVFFQRIAYLLLVIHNLLLLVLSEHPPIDPQDKGRGVVLPIIVEFGMDELWRHGVALVLGAKEQPYVVFGRAGLEAGQREEVLLAFVLAATLPLQTLHPETGLNYHTAPRGKRLIGQTVYTP